MGFAQQIYVIVQGYIDSKDDRGRSVNGAFLSVTSRRDIVYQRVVFGHDGLRKDMGWRELFHLNNGLPAADDRDPLMVHYGEELDKYLGNSMLLTAVAKNMNAKPAEQAVSRFCIDHLKLKAVCFASFVKASDADMELFRKPVASPPPESDETEFLGESQPEPEAGRETSREAGRETTGSVDMERDREIFVRCDPVLDPVSGVAMNDLSAGTHIYGRLAPDSIVYKLLAKNNRNFDGIISAQVSGIAMNNLGTATVSLILSDGIAGVMKLSGKVRVKTSPGPDGAARTRRPSPDSIPPEYIFVGLGFVLAVSAVFMFYYLFLF